MELGMMTAAWSYLEWHLGFLYKRLLGVTQEEAFTRFFRLNGTGARVNEIAQLLAVPDMCAEQVDGAESLLAEVKQLIGERNSLTHDVWFADSHSKEVLTFNFRAQPDTDERSTRREPRKVAEFRATILRLCERFDETFNQKPA